MGPFADKDTISIEEILRRSQSWGVPHFQRGSVWSSNNVAALLESLFYDTPCGSIILWEQDDEQYGVPLVKDRRFTHLLIDGQQRTRSVCAAFQGLADPAGETVIDAEKEEQAADAPDGADRFWAINLNRLGEFKGLLQVPEKRVWPLFVPVPDPRRADIERKLKMRKARHNGKARWNIPESPFKYNFVPLPRFREGRFEELLKRRRVFLKAADGKPLLPGHPSFPRALEQLGCVQQTVAQMATRRLFLRELGKNVNLDEAVQVFIRINSGGRPVQEEETAFSTLVAQCPATNDWIDRIFKRIHGSSRLAESPYGSLERDDAMARMNERSFGFKLFVRVFVLAATYHTERAIGTTSLSFSVLRDRRFLETLNGNQDTYERLWKVSEDVIVAIRSVLDRRLGLDALQFLPDTASLTPLFLAFIKYPDLLQPDLLESAEPDGVRVRPEFEGGIAHLALALLLANPTGQQVMKWASGFASTTADAETALEGLRKQVVKPLTTAFLRKALFDANSVMNRHTLLLYSLERLQKAQDFDYWANGLRVPKFSCSPRALEASCSPEKQHIVPYSYLADVYNLESRSRVSSTEANNIGNLTYISNAQNSTGGMRDTFLNLSGEQKVNSKNLSAHFITGHSRRAYNEVRTLIESGARHHSIKEAYEKWTHCRRTTLVNAFQASLNRLRSDWEQKERERQSRPRIEATEPLAGRATRGPGLAHKIRKLKLEDRIEDALISIFTSEGWLLESEDDEGGHPTLTLALQSTKRRLVARVEVSPDRVEVLKMPGERPSSINLTDPTSARELLHRVARVFARLRKGGTKGRA